MPSGVRELGQMVANEQKIRIRMYRVGFGECFLITLMGEDGKHHILIDCGVHPKGDIKTLDKAIDNIGQETGRKLDLIVATHRHQDHIAGFGTFAEEFQSFHVREAWLPWTESNDKEARDLRKKQMAMVKGLQRHFAAADNVRYGALKAALMNLSNNENSITLLTRDLGANVQYCEAGQEIGDAAGIEGLDVRVLGPPRGKDFLARMDPPVSQRYLWFGAGAATGPSNVQPFTKWHYEPHTTLLTEAEIAYFDEMTEQSGEALGFALTEAINNTSVVLLMSYAGQVMLFAGDAQYGNWQSWIEKEDAEAWLESVTFFKVAHHGSENATPKDALDRMSRGRFAAMVSTQNEPWPSIPCSKIMDALELQTGGCVVRSDSLTLAGAPKGPPIRRLPAGFRKGDFWFDYLF